MTLRLEGNNGGDVFEVEPMEDEDNRIRLKVGHCCVYVIDHIVPVEFLTAVLVKVVLDANGVIPAMQSIQWPKEFVDRLVSQIEVAE